MPAWFRCKQCEEKYYITPPGESSKFSGKCEKCGGILQEIFWDVQKLMERELIINFYLTEKQLSVVNEGKVLSVKDDGIGLLVDSDKSDNLLSELPDCYFSFARNEKPEGRFYFHSQILGYYQHDDPQVVVKTPEFLIRREERRAHRFELETTVKYRIADDFGKLIAMSDTDYNFGKTKDISKRGLLLVDNLSSSEIDNKYIDMKIEYDDYKISTIGNITRVKSVDETGDRKALGVKFLRGNSDALYIIDELRDKKVTY